MLQKNKRKICYISVPVAPPESISKHCLWWFEVLTLTAKKLIMGYQYNYGISIRFWDIKTILGYQYDSGISIHSFSVGRPAEPIGRIEIDFLR